MGQRFSKFYIVCVFLGARVHPRLKFFADAFFGRSRWAVDTSHHRVAFYDMQLATDTGAFAAQNLLHYHPRPLFLAFVDAIKMKKERKGRMRNKEKEKYQDESRNPQINRQNDIAFYGVTLLRLKRPI